MKIKLFKKILAAVLTAAMILSSSGFTAFAAEKVMVKGVYTNFVNATMASGTTKQIITYTEPNNATEQGMRFLTSNSKVATVTSKGLVSAVAPGKAVITVYAKDGSKEKQTVKITVLNNLLIDKSKIDSDNEIIIWDKTYGNVTIDNSIGDATLYLSGVTVKNKLIMEDGNYNVYLYDSSAKLVELAESKTDTVSFATENDSTQTVPGLFIFSNSTVSGITSGLNFNLQQDSTSQVNTITFDQTDANNSNLSLSGFTGNLVINSTGSGLVNLNASGCNILSVTVIGTTGSGAVLLSNTSDSQIGSLQVNGSANVNLQVPTGTVSINAGAQGATLTVGSTVSTLNNNGTGSNLNIASTIGNLLSSGAGAHIQLNQGASLEQQTVSGTGSSVQDNNPVYTGGGAGGAGSPATVVKIEAGAIIADYDFEDGVYNLEKRNTIGLLLTNVGNASGKSLLVSNRKATSDGVAISLVPFTVANTSKHVTISITADVMYDTGAATSLFKFTSDDGKYSTAGSATVNKGEWKTITGTYKVLGTTARVYLENDNLNPYYLDNLVVTINKVEDLVPVSSITVNKSSEILGVGSQTKISATVLPTTAEDTSVAYSSADASIASVDSTGLVTARKGGTVIITASANYGGLKAYTTIIVDPTIKVYKVGIDKKCLILTSLTGTTQLTATATLNASPMTSTITWSSSDTAIASVDQTGKITPVGLGTATITAQTVVDVDGTPQTFSATSKVIVDTNAVFAQTYDSADTAIGFTGRGNGKPAYEDGYIKVTGRTLGWHGAAYSVGSFAGKKMRITADVKHGKLSPTNIKITYNTGSTYPGIVNSGNIPVGEWMTITGTFDVKSTDASPIIYFESDDATADIYFDNVVISYVSDLTAVPTPSPSPTPTAGALPTPGAYTNNTNMALATNGGVVTASVAGEGTYAAVNDGNRSFSNSARWRYNAYPSWLEIDFNGTYPIETINLFAQQEASRTDEPTESMTSIYAINKFDVQAYDGTQWVAVPGGTVTSNDKVWYKLVLSTPVITNKIRINMPVQGRDSDNYARFIELEAFTPVVGGSTPTGTPTGTPTPTPTGTPTPTPTGTPSGTPTPTPVPALPISFNFEGEPVTTSSIGSLTAQTITTASMVTAVQSDFTTPSNKMLKVVNSNYNTVPKFSITLPEGKTLADYTQLTAKYYSVSGTDSAYKPAYLLAANSLNYTGASLDTCPDLIAPKVDSGFSGNGSWKIVTFSIDHTKATAVSGSAIEIAIGMSAPNNATFFLDEITLVPASGTADVVESFEGVAPVVGSAGQATVTGTVVTKSDFVGMLLTNASTNVLAVTNSNFNEAVKLTVTLAPETTISNYTSLSFKLYLPKTLATGDTQGFTYKDFTISIGGTVTSTSDASTLNQKWATASQQGTWVTVTSTITSAIKTNVGSATTFEIALGCHTSSTTAYYIDDITLIP